MQLGVERIFLDQIALEIHLSEQLLSTARSWFLLVALQAWLIATPRAAEYSVI